MFTFLPLRYLFWGGDPTPPLTHLVSIAILTCYTPATRMQVQIKRRKEWDREVGWKSGVLRKKDGNPVISLKKKGNDGVQAKLNCKTDLIKDILLPALKLDSSWSHTETRAGRCVLQAQGCSRVETCISEIYLPTATSSSGLTCYPGSQHCVSDEITTPKSTNVVLRTSTHELNDSLCPRRDNPLLPHCYLPWWITYTLLLAGWGQEVHPSDSPEGASNQQPCVQPLLLI